MFTESELVLKFYQEIFDRIVEQDLPSVMGRSFPYGTYLKSSVEDSNALWYEMFILAEKSLSCRGR